MVFALWKALCFALNGACIYAFGSARPTTWHNVAHRSGSVAQPGKPFATVIVTNFARVLQFGACIARPQAWQTICETRSLSHNKVTGRQGAAVCVTGHAAEVPAAAAGNHGVVGRRGACAGRGRGRRQLERAIERRRPGHKPETPPRRAQRLAMIMAQARPRRRRPVASGAGSCGKTSRACARIRRLRPAYAW